MRRQAERGNEGRQSSGCVLVGGAPAVPVLNKNDTQAKSESNRRDAAGQPYDTANATSGKRGVSLCPYVGERYLDG